MVVLMFRSPDPPASILPALPVGFLGWTNIAGAQHAMLSFPGVRILLPKSTFPKKWIHEIQLELEYADNGQTNLQSVSEAVGISSRLPVGVAQILLPFPETVTNLHVKRAEGILHGYSDFHLFGKSLFSREDERWTYALPDLVKLKQ
jgi:hypothetical protein